MTRKAKRATKVSNPPPLPSAPAPVPSIPTPTPSGTTTSDNQLDILTEDHVKMIQDALMWSTTPSLPKSTPDPFFSTSNQDFTHSFPRLIGDTAPIRAWCVKAR
jgi:hypothetical protein